MNTIKAQLAGLEDGSVARSSADPDCLRACVAGPLLREGDGDWYDAVVVWNGMVATVPALQRGGFALERAVDRTEEVAGSSSASSRRERRL